MAEDNDKSANENFAPSAQTQKQISDGVNFVYNWLTDRYEAGAMDKDTYNKCVDKIRNVKIFTSDHPSHRLISALQKGEIHLNQDLKNMMNEEKKTDEDIYKILMNNVVDDSHVAGFTPRNEEGISPYAEPVIFINVEHIKRENQNEKLPDVQSVVAHELTHVLGLEGSELNIVDALYNDIEEEAPSEEMVEIEPENDEAGGEGLDLESIGMTMIPMQGLYDFSIPPDEKIVREVMTPQIIVDDGKVFDNVRVNNSNFSSEQSYEEYLKDPAEVYARIMQMRYDMNLDPRKIYTPDDVEELRKEALKKRMQGHKTGEPFGKDFYIFDMFSNEQISVFLNETAQTEYAKGSEQNDMAALKQVISGDRQRYDNATMSGSGQDMAQHTPQQNNGPDLRQLLDWVADKRQNA